MGFTISLAITVESTERPLTAIQGRSFLKFEGELDKTVRDPELFEALKEQLGENVAQHVRGCARVIRKTMPEPKVPSVKKREASQKAKDRLARLPWRPASEFRSK